MNAQYAANMQINLLSKTYQNITEKEKKKGKQTESERENQEKCNNKTSSLTSVKQTFPKVTYGNVRKCPTTEILALEIQLRRYKYIIFHIFLSVFVQANKTISSRTVV